MSITLLSSTANHIRLLLELVTVQSSHAAARTHEGESELLKHLSASSRKPWLWKDKSLKCFADVKPFEGLVSDVQSPLLRLKTYF